MRTTSFRAALLLCGAFGLGRSTVAGAIEPTAAKGLAARIAEKVSAGLPVNLALVDVIAPERVAAGEGSTVSIAWRAAPQAGRVSVMVTVREGNREVGHGWARLKLSSMRRVLVASRELRAGDTVAGGDLVLADRPVDESVGWQMSAGALVGATILRATPSGRVVTEDNIALPAPLARGAAVRIVVRRGRVVVTASGTLERAARPGELAAARLTTSPRILNGRLVDRGTLLVSGDQL